MSQASFDGSERILPGAGREVRAAQYVRMSTDHQRYSIQNQGDAIARYADDHGLTIVRTYADSGKSGLTLEGRDALKELLSDVQRGLADFSVILVYDVSRWGRFPDADEAAYNEHLCKRAGISVRYCAEQFENDGSLTSTIIKGLKRAMAAEYSRELSVKVFAGQCRMVELGFRLGGPAGYGLRRMLVDENGSPKCELKPGQRKNIQSDRVVLIPGPDHEVKTVTEIYRLFVDKRLREKQIANILNGRGIGAVNGRRWERSYITDILTSEKYIGTAVFNRTSGKIGARRTPNPPDQWIRRENAFPAIVPPKLFWAAQRLIAKRQSDYTDRQLLAKLSALLSKNGKLNKTIINRSRNCPHSTTYRLRFGSLPNAYRLIGYTQIRNFLPKENQEYRRQIRKDTLANIKSAVEKISSTVENGSTPHSLVIDGEIQISVVVILCKETQKRDARWWLNFHIDVHSDIVVAVRLAPANLETLDYYLLPRSDLGWANAKLRRENDGFSLDRYRFGSLDRLYQLVARRNVKGGRTQIGSRNTLEEPYGSAGGNIALGPATSRAFQGEIARQKRAVARSFLARTQLKLVEDAVSRLYSDAYFLTLLRAEAMHTAPRIIFAAGLETGLEDTGATIDPPSCETMEEPIEVDVENSLHVLKNGTLTSIREHYLIMRLIGRGISLEYIAGALGVSVAYIRCKVALLSRISPEVVDLFKDRRVTLHVFDVLRKMTDKRQIEVANLMIAAGNHSYCYAKGLLAASRQGDLVKPKRSGGIASEQMARMEREIEDLQRAVMSVERSYGDDMLNLTIARGYIAKLISNDEIECYLEGEYPEILDRFRRITATAALA